MICLNASRRSILSLLVAIVLLCPECILSAEPADVPVSTPRPWIGITSTTDDGTVVCTSTYVRAVRQAGGLPVIIPVMKDKKVQAEYLRRLDALVVIGGGDIPPDAYGEKPHPTVKVMPQDRWEWERRLVAVWLKSDKPLLGICLGAQMTNVAAGGSLVQDIPSQVGDTVVHRHNGSVQHEVTIEPESRLRRILGVEWASVLSSHHQSSKRVGKGLRVVARSEDGVIEALETPGPRWLLALQWHPERMGNRHRQAIFGALVTAAEEYRLTSGQKAASPTQ